jgi:hypothetical protein
MARVVYKYPLPCSPRRCEILLPKGSKILPMYSRELDEGLTDDQDRGVSR